MRLLNSVLFVNMETILLGYTGASRPGQARVANILVNCGLLLTETRSGSAVRITCPGNLAALKPLMPGYSCGLTLVTCSSSVSESV